MLAQNWLPPVSLVFLGMRTQALPLAIWILLSIAAGAFTSLLITGFFNLSNLLASQQWRRKQRDVEAASSSSSTQGYKAASSANRSQSSNSNSNETNAADWDTNATDDDDWDFESEVRNSSPEDDVKNTDYERQQQPKIGYQSGSVYSYSYREPKNSAVGKTESVYDADYRVIAPPYRQTDTPKNDEDWGFEDDDDFDDDSSRKVSKR